MNQWVKLGGYSLFLWWATHRRHPHGLPVLRRRVRLPARRLPQDGQGPDGRGGPAADGHGGGGRAGTDGRVADAAVHHGHPLRRAVPHLRHVHRPDDDRRHRRHARSAGPAQQLLPQAAASRPAQPAVPFLVLRRRDGGSPGGVLDGATDLAVHHLAGRLGRLPDQPGDRVHPDHADQQPAAPSGVPRRQDQHGLLPRGRAEPGGRPSPSGCTPAASRRSSAAGRPAASRSVSGQRRQAFLVPLPRPRDKPPVGLGSPRAASQG